MTAVWSTLGDAELAARLRQRGLDPAAVDYAVHHREDPHIIEALDMLLERL